MPPAEMTHRRKILKPFALSRNLGAYLTDTGCLDYEVMLVIGTGTRYEPTRTVELGFDTPKLLDGEKHKTDFFS